MILPASNEMEIFGREMRKVAMTHPCLASTDCADPMYSRLVSFNYHVSLTLEMYHSRPMWHGSVAVLSDVGHGTDKTLGIPDQAMLRPMAWSKEEHSNAQEILGYCMGPVIIDKKQQIVEQHGLFGIHWITYAAQQIPFNVLNKRDPQWDEEDEERGN